MSVPLKVRRLPETAGVHFLLRPHHYILKVITQFRNGGPRANTYVDGSVLTGILERNGISGWINQRDIYFHNLLGINWHMQTGGNAVLRLRPQ